MLRRRLLKASALLLGGVGLPIPALAAAGAGLPYRWIRLGAIARQDHCQLDILHASTAPSTLDSRYIERAQLRFNDLANADRVLWSMRSRPVLNLGRESSQRVAPTERLQLQLRYQTRDAQGIEAKSVLSLRRGNAYLLIGPNQHGRPIARSELATLLDQQQQQCDIYDGLSQLPTDALWLNLS